MVSVEETHFDLNSANALPDTYTWLTPQNQSQPSQGPVSIPVIDLDDIDVIDKIGRACEVLGLFLVINHGVPEEILRRIESEARRFFSLPADQKLRAKRIPGDFTGYGPLPISKFFEKKFWSEGFTILGSPIKPASAVWPDGGHTQFCDTVNEYQQAILKLQARMLGLVMRYLGIEDENDWLHYIGEKGALQLNSYPPCPDPDRALGLGAHGDSTLLTVLHQTGEKGGLQCKIGEDQWALVTPKPGSLVVNVGDLLHIISNGRLPTAVHRVIVDADHHRYSFVNLWGTPPDVKVMPHPKLVGPGKPPLYRAVTWMEYLGIKTKILNEALDSIRVHENLGDDESIQNHNN
ncbi:Gibberellin 3-beta-dioxygenase 1 [Acorus calamus]|uniref:Gibberellin 3-beta-dioxygenase 1 n=1 Tax=Acorus calamus TaxID=4465 RepID=A0AAV9CV53_ACOCL|nr:Gibberellin 3-beta-dioxygenase 1 [Acorus calamus]